MITYGRYCCESFSNNYSCNSCNINVSMFKKIIIFFLEISCGVPPNGTNTIVTSISLLYQNTYNYETNGLIHTECLANGSLSLEHPPNCTSRKSCYNWQKRFSFLSASQKHHRRMLQFFLCSGTNTKVQQKTVII